MKAADQQLKDIDFVWEIPDVFEHILKNETRGEYIIEFATPLHVTIPLEGMREIIADVNKLCLVCNKNTGYRYMLVVYSKRYTKITELTLQNIHKFIIGVDEEDYTMVDYVEKEETLTIEEAIQKYKDAFERYEKEYGKYFQEIDKFKVILEAHLGAEVNIDDYIVELQVKELPMNVLSKIMEIDPSPVIKSEYGEVCVTFDVGGAR